MVDFSYYVGLSFIVGKDYYNFLSLDLYNSHFLLPFSPRFRVIDFCLGTLYNAGLKKICILSKESKEIIYDYVSKKWLNNTFFVFDNFDFNDFTFNFLLEYINENSINYIVFIFGSYPVWFEMDKFSKYIQKTQNFAIYSNVFGKEIIHTIFLDKNLALKLLENYFLNKNSDIFEFSNIVNDLKLDCIEVKGYIYPINDIKDYYQIHLQMIDDYLLLDNFNAIVPILSEFSGINTAKFGKDAYIKNSIFGENVEIEGYIENSVIFTNVKIKKNAYIKNSLIFPGNHIGKKVRIINSIIDEFSEDNSLPNIEPNCKIGNENFTSYNINFPDILNFGITLIGKDNKIPSNMEIGSNCYIDSFTSFSVLKKIKKLQNGYSILISSNE